MKTFTFLLPFYLLWLSCIPCADRQEFFMNEGQHLSKAVENNPHQNNNDTCTPFCNCACCATGAFNQILPDYQLLKRVFQTVKFPVYTASEGVNIAIAIWQPPKLV